MAVLGPRAGTAALLILVLFAGLPFVRPAQAERVLGITWDRTYVHGLAGPYSSHQTSDGGFIMSGESSGAWVMKTNAAGMPEWQRRFIPSGYIDADGVIIPTNDGGYILVGSALPACCRGGGTALGSSNSIIEGGWSGADSTVHLQMPCLRFISHQTAAMWQ